MDQPVGIAVVGLGWWACDVHIPNLREVPGARLAALCSRSAEGIERGLAAAGDDASPRCFRTYGELLRDGGVDAVLLCTPNHTHAARALEALRAGKHVLVEKPLALRPPDCAPILAEAAQRGLVVQVGLELRYSDVVQAMRRQIDAGHIGEPRVVRTHVWRQWRDPRGWRADPANSGGTFHELAIHYLHLLNVAAGGRPAWVAAPGGAGVSRHDVSYTLTTIGYENGALGSLAFCLFAAGSEDSILLEAVGTEGRLLGQILKGRLNLWRADGSREDLSPARGGDEAKGFPGSRESLADFVDCIATGRRPLVNGEEGELLCRLCEAARHSLADGGPQVPIAAPA